MSTRSVIRVLRNDGKVYSQYVHFDGYGHLPTLQKNYNTQELAEKLSNLGWLSSLAESADCPKGHNFKSPVEGYCVAYGRDRGDKGTAARPYSSFKEAWIEEDNQEYVYEWDGKEWKGYKSPTLYPPLDTEEELEECYNERETVEEYERRMVEEEGGGE